MRSERFDFEYVWFCPFCDWSLIASGDIYLVDVESALEDHFDVHVEEMVQEAYV